MVVSRLSTIATPWFKTDRQQDQTHQMSTSMHEMSSTVNEISRNSNVAADAARKASETPHCGGQVVEQTLVTMRSIAESLIKKGRLNHSPQTY